MCNRIFHGNKHIQRTFLHSFGQGHLKMDNSSFIFSEICQMRLDFDNFDITETTAGVCTDSFTIAGQSGQNPLDLCGTLTGQHSKSLIFLVSSIQKIPDL